MPVTIYDIAKRTGYSPPTISKALNNQPDISESTKIEIVAIAQEMGYIPNQHAKALVTKKSWLIGVIFEEADLGLGMEHPLFAGIMNSFKQRVEQEGYELMFIAQNLGRKKMSYLDHCRYRGVDGVLILNNDAESNDVHEVIRGPFPCVSANLVYPDILTVTSENLEPAVQAVSYLRGLGHTKIAHIAGPQHSIATAGLERYQGYLQGLIACGLEYRPEFVLFTKSWNEQSGYEAMRELLGRAAQPTSVFISSDVLSMGALRACREFGVRVPEDLSLISFDDNEAARYIHPALTTFRQNRNEIGRTAAELMLQKIGRKEPQMRVKIPVRLIERESCLRLSPVHLS